MQDGGSEARGGGGAPGTERRERDYAVLKCTETLFSTQHDSVAEHSVLEIVPVDFNPTPRSLPPCTATAITDSYCTAGDLNFAFNIIPWGSSSYKSYSAPLPTTHIEYNQRHLKNKEIGVLKLFSRPGDRLKDPAQYPLSSRGNRPQELALFFHWVWGSGEGRKIETRDYGKQRKVITAALRQALKLEAAQSARDEPGEHMEGYR